MHRLVDNDLEWILHVKLCSILRSAFRLMYQSWSVNFKRINRKEWCTCGQKKNKIPNSQVYFRPGRVGIRWRFGPKPMQLFSNSKIVIFIGSRSKCTALHWARYSTQKLPCRRNFVHQFRIYHQTHDNPRNFEITVKNRFWLLLPGGFFISSEVEIWINWLQKWNPCISNASTPEG